MKKLTKRVQAGGLWFDAPVWADHVQVGRDGYVYYSNGRLLRATNAGVWYSLDLEYVRDGNVDLEGSDWRECCWYIGDQEDGELIERRRWVARGIESAMDVIHSLYNDSYLVGRLEKLASQVRSGEIDQ